MASEIPTSVRFDESTKDRLRKLTAESKIPAKTLIEIGVTWFLDYVEKTGSIPVRYVSEEHAAHGAGNRESQAAAAGQRPVVRYRVPTKTKKAEATAKK